MTSITRIEDLETLYGAPGEASLVKEATRLTPHYRALLAAAPFYALATSSPEGLDCSPRGDLSGGIVIADETTLYLPDRRGNNRLDSLRNIVRDPRVALLFLIPGSGTTLRINGRAVVSIAPDLLAACAAEGKPPRSVIVVTIETVYFQCARAILRADLWNPARHVAAEDLPTAGEILAAMSQARVGGPDYDREWPERAKSSLW